MRGRRVFGFLIGAALGCGLVAVLWNTRPEFQEHKVLRPWQGRVVFVKDSEKREDGSWDRIRVIEDPGWHTYVRLEECLIKTPRHRGSQVTARVAMSAEHVDLIFEDTGDEGRIWVAEHLPIGLGENFVENHLTKSQSICSLRLPCRPEADDVGYWLAQAKQNPWLTVSTSPIEDPTAR